MFVRTHTWLQNNLSWAVVMYELINAFQQLGHETFVVSTNGLGNNPLQDKKILERSALELRRFGPGKRAIDLDLTYTVPINVKQRYLLNSKHKALIYNYETFPYWPPHWKRFYSTPDYFFPSSSFSAEIFLLNGVPNDKLFVIPHGVDTKRFNPTIPPIKLKTKKRYKFGAVVAPHYRKNIPTMLEAYCQTFTAKDDVCLVLKTKIWKQSDPQKSPQNPNGRQGFEIPLYNVLGQLAKKYGKSMPEIEIVQGYIDNVASFYNAIDCHVSTTGAECFYMPGLEVMACEKLQIAPNYSGHLDFLNKDNALLIDTDLRPVRAGEQYWARIDGSWIGQPRLEHTKELMELAYKNGEEITEQMRPKFVEGIRGMGWTDAAQKMIDVCEGKVEPYVAGGYNLGKYRKIRK